MVVTDTLRQSVFLRLIVYDLNASSLILLIPVILIVLQQRASSLHAGMVSLFLPSSIGVYRGSTKTNLVVTNSVVTLKASRYNFGQLGGLRGWKASSGLGPTFESASNLCICLHIPQYSPLFCAREPRKGASITGR